ncbi:MAG TPA: DNA mismatch repair endonuclease MutL [Thermoanaerobaculia bacterium]|nr:DNA mismatch repair endonuclease MutL [Thermoanaerobaculia bacterium]
MQRIKLLSSDLINKIAAGEVIERPSSVVKELVENAIDAGARSIEIVLEGGGKKLIEVSDDGSGMSHADALLSVERHATSKIRNFDDLSSISTLGFRGEALPSIASVSSFTITTWDGIEEHGISIHTDPIAAVVSKPAARDRGTTIRVAELFENVPARRKFLKSADAEFRAIVTVVSSYALPSPDRAFRLEHNGRTVLDLPRAESGRHRVEQLLGSDVAPHLSPIELSIAGCNAAGFVTRGVRFGSRRNQYFFVNGRLVRDRVLTHAATRACEAFDFDGHPGIVLFLGMNPESVDVNVHPAKTEVRFRDSGAVHVLVEQSIKAALGGAEEGARLLTSHVAAVHDSPDSSTSHGLDFQEQLPGASLSYAAETAIRRESIYEVAPLFQQRPLVQPPREDADLGPASIGDLQGRVIGQYRMSYILCDVPGGLRLVDQHVAHERVLYDRFERLASIGGGAMQHLLTPYIHDAGAAEGAVLESQLTELRNVGFEIERFSGRSFAITAVPSELRVKNLAGFFAKLVDAALEERGSHLTHLREKMLASIACQAAIKVHRPLGGEEMSLLLGDLLASSNPYACPHGRPVIVDIRHLDIEKHFHRK